MTSKQISKSTMQRLPGYLAYLRALPADAPLNISASSLSAALNLGEVQVRKDLAAVSGSGKPKIGYMVSDLILDLETFLGYDNVNDAVIVGAGKLGRAFLDYKGFRDYGLNIVAAFDSDRRAEGVAESGKVIYDISELPAYCAANKIRLAVLTVPAESAQETCEKLAASGVLGILNFAPTHLKAPPDILVENVNMAASLAMLAKHLNEQIKQ